VELATSKNLVVKRSMFPHKTLHRYTLTSPDSKTYNQTDHTLTNTRWHSSVLDVRSFRGADSDIDHYLMVAKFRERLAVSKLLTQKLGAASFYNKKLSELEVRKQYQNLKEVCNIEKLKY
jgi:hypothetical protein